MIYKPLGQFVRLSQGLAINKSTNHLVSANENEEFCYPLLRIADMMENRFTKFISKEVNPTVVASQNDIIYTRTGQIGLVFRGYKGVVHNNSFIIKLINDEIDENYLYTLLQSNFVRTQALKLAKNSVQPDLTHEMFKSIMIPIPENKIEQIEISKSYNTIVKKIKTNNEIISELESLAKTIYDYWFLQFEFPNEDGKPYKSSGGKMVWNEELKREIPEGWEVERFCNLASFTKGKIPTEPLAEKPDGDTTSPYVTIDVANGASPMYCNPTKMISLNGETIMVMDGAASGDVYVGNFGILGSTFSKITSERNDISNSLIYMTLKEHSAIYKKANTGSTVPHANAKFINQLKFPISKNNSYFSKKLDVIFNQIKVCKDQNQELASLRDFLLPMLMNGQVTFKD